MKKKILGACIVAIGTPIHETHLTPCKEGIVNA